MSGFVMVPAGYQSDIAVLTGPRLLAGVPGGPSLDAHRAIWRKPVTLSGHRLVAVVERARILGRGGAGFPFARKLATALESGRRRHLVVNAAEGEPGSAKDSALLTAVPHLVLDGAETVAHALRTSRIHLVVPGERPAVAAAARAAVRERAEAGGRFRYLVRETSGGFVGGQARAVLELLDGRENLPVTAWRPEAVAGLKGRPTLLSNVETFAQVAVLAALGAEGYRRVGTADEPGTTLLTVAGDGPGGVVLEAELGEPLAAVLQRCGYAPDLPVLLGGYHGTWLAPEQTARRRMCRADLAAAGATLGAGVVLPLDRWACPVVLTARIVAYLAGQSARRCGPCVFGLAALAEAVDHLAEHGGLPASRRIRQVAGVGEATGLVAGRGACAHPDGTVRLVRSLYETFGEEVRAHESGICLAATGAPALPATGSLSVIR